MTEHDSETRRRFVRLLACGLGVGLTGCSDPLTGAETPTPEQGDVTTGGAIESVEVLPPDLVVTLDESAAITDVRVLGPEDDVWSSGPLSGASVHTFDLFEGDGYTPGIQTIEALNSDDDALGTATLPLIPNLQLTAFGLGSQYRDRVTFPDSVDRPDKVPVVELENPGSGPDRVTGIEMMPAQDAYTPTEIHGTRTLSPDSSGLVYNEHTTFFEGYNVDQRACGETHTWELTVRTAVGQDLTTTVEITSEITDDDTYGFFYDADCETTGAVGTVSTDSDRRAHRHSSHPG